MALKKKTDSKDDSTLKKPKSAKTSASKKISTKKSTQNEARKVDAEILSDDEPIDRVDPVIDEDFESSESSSTTEATDNQGFAIVPSTGTAPTVTKDPLTLYLNEIRKYPLLTKEQELDLAKRYYETKDPQLAQTLVNLIYALLLRLQPSMRNFLLN